MQLTNQTVAMLKLCDFGERLRGSYPFEHMLNVVKGSIFIPYHIFLTMTKYFCWLNLIKQ